jgi:glycosyltransferase involved in cell wall biosynthesis
MSAPLTGRRICFVATGLARGGAEVQLYHAVVGLRARGFDLHVVCILSRDYWGDRLEAKGVPVIYLDASRTSSPLRILSRFLRAMKQVQPAAVAGVDYPGAMLARVGGWAARVPVVVSSIHSENFGGVLRRFLLRWTDSLATVTTAVSQRMAGKLVSLGAAPRRVRVIPNGIDMVAVGPHLRDGRAALRQSLGVQDGEFLWVAAGRLEEPKDYPNLVAATALVTKAFPRVKVAIAGRGPLLDAVRADIAARGLDGVVSLLGMRADGVVLSSAWEGLPNVVIEAHAVAAPIVTTEVGGVREIVQDGRSGFVVPPRDASALAEGMVRLMTLPEAERRRMGLAGRTHVQESFALEGVLGQWHGLFTELLATA